MSEIGAKGKTKRTISVDYTPNSMMYWMHDCLRGAPGCSSKEFIPFRTTYLSSSASSPKEK